MRRGAKTYATAGAAFDEAHRRAARRPNRAFYTIRLAGPRGTCFIVRAGREALLRYPAHDIVSVVEVLAPA